jgi:hypothetical protein
MRRNSLPESEVTADGVLVWGSFVGSLGEGVGVFEWLDLVEEFLDGGKGTCLSFLSRTRASLSCRISRRRI